MLKPADKTIRASDMRFDFILLRRLTKRLKPIHPPKQDGFFLPWLPLAAVPRGFSRLASPC